MHETVHYVQVTLYTKNLKLLIPMKSEIDVRKIRKIFLNGIAIDTFQIAFEG